MDHVIEEFTAGDHTVTIYADPCPESPREWDNLGTFLCAHSRYTLGDINATRADLQAKHDAIPARSVILPVYLYDHSGLRVSTTPFSCPWDSGQVGVIYCSPEKACKEYGWSRLTQKRRDKVRDQLKAEIETLDQYLCGDVYGYTIACEGETVASCWGFFGLDYCRDEARAEVEAMAPDPQLVFEF